MSIFHTLSFHLVYDNLQWLLTSLFNLISAPSLVSTCVANINIKWYWNQTAINCRFSYGFQWNKHRLIILGNCICKVIPKGCDAKVLIQLFRIELPYSLNSSWTTEPSETKLPKEPHSQGRRSIFNSHSKEKEGKRCFTTTEIFVLSKLANRICYPQIKDLISVPTKSHC